MVMNMIYQKENIKIYLGQRERCKWRQERESGKINGIGGEWDGERKN